MQYLAVTWFYGPFYFFNAWNTCRCALLEWVSSRTTGVWALDVVVLCLCQRAKGRDLCWASCFAEWETEAAGARMGVWTPLSPFAWGFCAATAGPALVKSPFSPCNVCCRWNVSCSFSHAVPGERIGLEGGGFLLSLLLSPDSWFPLAWLFFRRHTIELTLILILFF